MWRFDELGRHQTGEKLTKEQPSSSLEFKVRSIAVNRTSLRA
jgi:hypothetical protein